MATPSRIGWEACTWIAAIAQEKAKQKDGTFEDRAALCNPVLAAAKANKVEIATSALSLVEVCKKQSVKLAGKDKIESFFRNPYVLVVPLNTEVATIARDLMIAGYAGLKPPDASHLASALVANVTELHTFDDDLLKLDGKIARLDSGFLRICKPKLVASPIPLFETPEV